MENKDDITQNRQNKVLELIKIFDEVCKKHNIWYTLTSGSVLGAIRHSGFILGTLIWMCL